MGNPIKREYDKLSITRDIIEREQIVRQFQTTGFLDHDDAIKKITSIQLTDDELAAATLSQQIQYGIADLCKVKEPRIIITNMQFQIEFLKAKLAKLELEDKENGGK